MQTHYLTGIEFRFGCAVDDIVVSTPSSEEGGGGEGFVKRITGLKLRDGSVLDTDLVVLAPGHSARVLYEKLIEKGVSLEPKPIAVHKPSSHSIACHAL